MKRDAILDTAKGLVTGERADAHGDAENSFGAIAALWNAYLDHIEVGGLSPHDVAQMMVLFKVGRATQNRWHADNYVDAAGYSALAGEMGMGNEG